MFRPLLAAAVAPLLLFPAAAWAGYAEGVRAFGTGRHDVAAREFLAAAQAGDAESAYMLGRLYTMGSGVPQDWGQAWVWHDRAARQGHELAREARDDLAAIMTPEQLTRVHGAVVPPASATSRPVAQPSPAPPPAAGRQAVVVLRDGASPRSASAPDRPYAVVAPATEPARMVANGPTYEGMLQAAGGLQDQVRLVQRRLNREGYFAGPVDGVVGHLTRQAIANYQRDHGLAPTGRLSAEVVARLAAAPPTAVVRVEAVPEQQAEAR